MNTAYSVLDTVSNNRAYLSFIGGGLCSVCLVWPVRVRVCMRVRTRWFRWGEAFTRVGGSNPRCRSDTIVVQLLRYSGTATTVGRRWYCVIFRDIIWNETNNKTTPVARTKQTERL